MLGKGTFCHLCLYLLLVKVKKKNNIVDITWWFVIGSTNLSIIYMI